MMCLLTGYSRTKLLSIALPELMMTSKESLSTVFDAVLTLAAAHPATKAQVPRNDQTVWDVVVDYRCFNDDGNWIIVATFKESASYIQNSILS